MVERALLKFTPPLRGSRGSRAVCAKADSVGGKMRFIATPNYTPHRIAFGLTPSALRLPLKGGVDFLSPWGVMILKREWFWNSSRRGAVSLGAVHRVINRPLSVPDPTQKRENPRRSVGLGMMGNPVLSSRIAPQDKHKPSYFQCQSEVRGPAFLVGRIDRFQDAVEARRVFRIMRMRIDKNCETLHLEQTDKFIPWSR